MGPDVARTDPLKGSGVLTGVVSVGLCEPTECRRSAKYWSGGLTC